MKTRKNMTGPHASCAFRKWAKYQKRFQANKCKKNAYENDEKYNRATCLSVFRKWTKCQKRS